ncbi:MAG: methyltransferase domain-containing protein [Terracidiphilus sp.]|jgi:ubiquinone/menaquinone biosynthesis C-methylase UbiE
MTYNLQLFRRSQILASAIAALFILGFFFPFIGVWTGIILAVWFAGTQRPLQGFVWLLALNYLPSLFFDRSNFPETGVVAMLEYVAWMLAASVLTVLPFTFHRVVSPRLNGFLSTLPLPLAATAVQTLVQPQLPLELNHGFSVPASLIYWFAAVIIWMWHSEFNAEPFLLAVGIFATIQTVALAVSFISFLGTSTQPKPFEVGTPFAWLCLLGTAALAIYSLVGPGSRHTWTNQPKALARLQSPNTGDPLQFVHEKDRDELRTPSGERFPIRNGIPVFLKPADLTDANHKSNEIYEMIGGFYDDIQRVFLAFKGLDREAYFRSYIDRLQVKLGDSVLETSVGTGLNFKYLPRGVELSGLDLSPEMLLNCRANLRRWRLEADLFVGNAEALPFADSAFDVVFHVGGINYFSDRAKAIREMIRVAKPGSVLLIADGSEKHVKGIYETMLGKFFKNRKEAVSPPVDLVPPEMQEIHLEEFRGGQFYALTFRKPNTA